MSEPVGNSPRGEIQGNSHRERAAKPAPAAERPKVEKIVTGAVVTRKPPWYKRIAGGIVADDAQSIGDFIVTDIIIPNIKNVLYDIITGSAGRALYPGGRVGARGPRLGHRGESSIRVKYDDMDRPSPRSNISREARARHDFTEVILSDREEAVAVVEDLIERVMEFGQASVADMYDLVGTTGSFADQKWGWTDLRDADVKQVRQGWLIDLPKPVHLRS